jgi:hypothetical protein
MGRAFIAVVTVQPVPLPLRFPGPLSLHLIVFHVYLFSVLSSGCHPIILMRNGIGYIVAGLQRGISLERVVSPRSPETSSRCQYFIVTYCNLSLLLIHLSLWAGVVIVGFMLQL